MPGSCKCPAGARKGFSLLDSAGNGAHIVLQGRAQPQRKQARSARRWRTLEPQAEARMRACTTPVLGSVHRASSLIGSPMGSPSAAAGVSDISASGLPSSSYAPLANLTCSAGARRHGVHYSQTERMLAGVRCIGGASRMQGQLRRLQNGCESCMTP
jgi:hypothetical protein